MVIEDVNQYMKFKDGLLIEYVDKNEEIKSKNKQTSYLQHNDNPELVAAIKALTILTHSKLNDKNNTEKADVSENNFLNILNNKLKQ